MQIRMLTWLAVAVLWASTALAQQQNDPHLYFFTSPSCGPCRQVEPEIHLLQSKNYPVTIVDINQRPDLARRFQVNRTPVTLLVSDNQIVGRKAGLIDARTIVGWFQTANAARAKSRLRESKSNQQAPPRTHVSNNTIRSASPEIPVSQVSSTVHKGTRVPGTETEFNAMRATVRLKVEDPEGISFATGTVIHSQNGECLVLTCGHVFRDAQGKGVITADLGFEGQETRTFPGKLVSYDAGPRDIGLVIVETGFDLPAVSLAPSTFPVQRGDQVFSIGCDHGQDATIRRTRIKNQALYDKAKKYDIYGRPVDGRSGGGLFTAGGQLIGVCNAAAVEVDEGVYTSLDNIYWQIAEVNLTHLFQPGSVNPHQAIASRDRLPSRGAGFIKTPDGTVRTNPVDNFNSNRNSAPPNLDPGQVSGPMTVADTQVIVVLQSKSNPQQAETLVINNPSEALLSQIRAHQTGPAGSSSDRFAELRRQMPIVPRPGDRPQYRAQSPR